jgi:hypothetical protein
LGKVSSFEHSLKNNQLHRNILKNKDMDDYEPTYLDDVEEARNRPDKSILAIKTMCPEKLLAADVALTFLLWQNIYINKIVIVHSMMVYVTNAVGDTNIPTPYVKIWLILAN